jgi:hypothetical protein
MRKGIYEKRKINKGRVYSHDATIIFFSFCCRDTLYNSSNVDISITKKSNGDCEDRGTDHFSET